MQKTVAAIHKPTVIILLLLCIFSLQLRMYLFPSRLFFGPEQGHDFLVIRDIIENKNLTLIGPKTDIDGIFHGPIFYYLATIPFAFTGGNPVAVSYFFIAIYSISVFAMYKCVISITQEKRTALISSVLYTVSFGLIVYTRWLSGQPLSVPLSVLYVYFVSRALQKNTWGLFGAAATFALLGQAELINFPIFGTITLLIALRYKRDLEQIPLRYRVAALLSCIILSVANFILFDVLHDHLISRRIFDVLGNGSLTLAWSVSFVDAWKMFFDQIAYTIGSRLQYVGVILASAGIYILLGLRKKLQFLDIVLFWVYAPPFVLAAFRHGVLEQMYSGSVAGYIIIIGISVSFLISKFPLPGYIIFLSLIFMNVYSIIRYFPDNRSIFFEAPQPEVRYTDQLQVIDKIYSLAEGKPFSVQSYTIPYFWQDAWTYLFTWYGKKKYGYIPTEPTDILYVIIQKDHANEKFQQEWLTNVVSSWGRKNRSFAVGEYTVEELIVQPSTVKQ